MGKRVQERQWSNCRQEMQISPRRCLSLVLIRIWWRKMEERLIICAASTVQLKYRFSEYGRWHWDIDCWFSVAISHALRLLKGQSNEEIVPIGGERREWEWELSVHSELEAFQLNRALIEISKGGKNHAISLDGGGIRGLVLIEVWDLESELKCSNS